MATIETRANWGAGFIAGFGARALEAENQADMAYSLASAGALGIEAVEATRLLKKRTTQQGRETIVAKTGVGKGTITPEGSDFATDSRESTYQTQLNPIKITDSVEMTLEARNDVERNIADVMDAVFDMRVGWMQTRNEHSFSPFNYGFTAQASLPDQISYYADGVPLFSTLHPIAATTTSNTTQSNASSTGIVFSESNLETGRLALLNQKDDKDLLQKYGAGRLILLIPPDLEKNAVIVTKSAKRSGTANNDLNIYDGIVTCISTKWVGANATGGSATAWFLIDSMFSPFIELEREGYTPSTWVRNSNKNLVYDYYSRYCFGHKNFRGSWGSKGDAAAYSS